MPRKPPSYRPNRPRPPEHRPSAAARGYDRRWRERSKLFLDEHPTCTRCEAAGRLTGAAVVDHVVPHRGDRDRFWDESNWQPLCEACHNAKTAREDGGLGRPRASR